MLGFYNYTVILTYISLCSGVTGVYFALAHQRPGTAVICLLLSGLCDAFDGRIARMRKESTEQEKRFGIQIDSLSDLLCFGLLPCCIGYASGMKHPLYVPFFCLFVLAALIRLAYFNVTEEERQKKTSEKRKHYSGLPVTSISVIMPLIYLLFFTSLKAYMEYVLFGLLLIVGASFVIEKITIKKPNFKGIMVMVVIGFVEFVILLLVKLGIIQI